MAYAILFLCQQIGRPNQFWTYRLRHRAYGHRIAPNKGGILVLLAMAE
jgi:hypothetical protein